MGRPRFHSMRRKVAVMITTGAFILAITGQAAAMRPWQKAWGDYDSHNQWHDAAWWLKNRHHWVTVNHPEWTDNYADTYGQIGDSDALHEWHYGDGSFDRDPTVDQTPHQSPKVT